MEYLVFLMPALGALPVAVAAVLIARMWLRNRNQQGELAEQVEELQAALEAVRAGQADLQERVDFAERMLTRFRDQQRLSEAPDQGS